MAARSRRRIVAAVLLAVLLGLLLPPYVSLKRYRGRIGEAIGRAMGRQVTVDDATLRLLPRPGFGLRNLVVADDPAFSAEPMLRAETVTATVRLTSLWRGRLEIASLSLDDPSLNLVRREDGHWNLEALLMRAAQVPTAPTGRPRAEARARFPYIEAGNGRINFKLGQEKKVFALVDSDFALWLESEDEWHTRLRARPVRTDSNLSNTGELRLNGTFRRAASFRETPLALRFALEDAQLGQLTTLVYGRDRGWRGTADFSGTLTGSPADLGVQLEARLDDFRRYDIISGEEVRLQARCQGRYELAAERLHAIDCRLPLGEGTVQVRGEVAGLFQRRTQDVRVVAADLPVASLLQLARHAKRDLAGDLTGAGDLDAAFNLRSTPEGVWAWTGGGNAAAVVLRSSTLGRLLELGDIQFAVHPPEPPRSVRRGVVMPAAYGSTTLIVAPVALPLGGAAPAQLRAVVTGKDYSVSLAGDADLGRLMRLAQTFGLRSRPAAVTGQAKADLTIAGAWAGFSEPAITGTLDLRNARFDLPGVADPLLVSTASVRVSATEVHAGKLHARFAGIPPLEGAVTVARPCNLLESCRVLFDLRTDSILLDEVNRLLNPRARKRPWYSLGAGEGRGLPWQKLEVRGQLSAARLVSKGVSARAVTAEVAFDRGRLDAAVKAEVFGGQHSGEWRADFTGPAPTYSGSGKVEGAAMALVAGAMRDNWAAGIAGGAYRLTLSGWDAPELVESLSGSFDFHWRDGVLRHLLLEDGAPLHFRRFAGRATVRERALTFSESKLESGSRIYEVSGSVSFGRALDLTLQPRGGRPVAVTGTLLKPTVVEGAPAETALKR